MIGAMYVLVVLCFFVGLAPMWVGPVLEQAVNAWIGPTSESLTPLATLAPLGSISAMALTLIALLVVASAGLWWRMRSGGVAFAPTWGCGFAAPTPRMQYTSSSFAEMLVGLFGWALRPRVDRVQITELLPPASSFHSEVRDPVLDELVLPAFRFSAWLVSWFRVFQQGKIQAYLLYMFVALVALLLWR